MDKEFKDRQSQLNEKLARESQFTNWVYYVPAFTMDSLLKTRGELLADVQKDESPTNEPPKVGN